MSGVDSHLSTIHRPPRFIDVVDEEWVTHQLPSETLFRNVSELDDDDDDDVLTTAAAAADALDHFAMLGANAHASAPPNAAVSAAAAAAAAASAASLGADDGNAVAFRWNDLALAPFLASAPQRPQPPASARND